MRNDGIDASLGLAFSLELFKRYRQSGILQAEIPRMPGIRGRCTAFLYLVNGEVTSVYLEDKQQQRYTSDKEVLCRLDKEKGPFEWTLLPQPQPVTPEPFQVSGQMSFAGGFAPPAPPSPIPRIVAVLTPDRLSTWNSQQKEALFKVLININGVRTIEEVKGMVPFPPDLVDELLRILLELNVIALSA